MLGHVTCITGPTILAWVPSQKVPCCLTFCALLQVHMATNEECKYVYNLVQVHIPHQGHLGDA